MIQKCASFFFLISCLSLSHIIHVLYYFTLLPLNSQKPVKMSLPEGLAETRDPLPTLCRPGPGAVFSLQDNVEVWCRTASYLLEKRHPGWTAQDLGHPARQLQPPLPRPGSASGGSDGARPVASPRTWGSARSPPWPWFRIQGLLPQWWCPESWNTVILPHPPFGNHHFLGCPPPPSWLYRREHEPSLPIGEVGGDSSPSSTFQKKKCLKTLNARACLSNQ